MEYVISKGERVLVAVLINSLPGVNRTDARLVTKVSDHLALEEVGSVPVVELGEVNEFDLAELEVSWITDHLNKAFEKQEVPPGLAKHALSLEEKLKVEEQEDDTDPA